MRRSFVVNPDDMKRINVIAEREGVTPSTVIRGLIHAYPVNAHTHYI